MQIDAPFAISTTDAGRVQRGIHANRGVDEGDHGGDADHESAFEAELRRVNHVRAHTVGLVIAVENTLAFSWRGISLLPDDVAPSRARGMVVVHGASLPIALLAAFATLDRFARTPWLVGYRRRVGERVAVHTAESEATSGSRATRLPS
jgi:hypothetical protein